MQITLKHQPSYALAVVQLAAGESLAAEPGAMVSMSADAAMTENMMRLS